MQDSQLRQQQSLLHEIRLLEKQKRDLQSELEHGEATRKEEFRQSLQQIKGLTKRRNDLQEEVNKSRDTLTILTEAYDQSKAGMDEYIKKHLADAHKEAQTVVASAKITEANALERLREAEILEKNNEEKSMTLALKETTNEAIARENDATRITLDLRREDDMKLHQRSEEALFELEKTKQRLEGEVANLKEMKTTLVADITAMREDSARKEQLLEAKEDALIQFKTSLMQKEEVMTLQEKGLTERELLLKDRQGTLDRAIAEFREKGVKI